MSLYVAAYDIGHDNRRAAVARVLQRYGHRVQESVFEVWLEPEDLPEFRRAVGPLLDSQDEFDLFPIDERGTRRRIRWQRPPDGWAPVIVL